MTKPLDIYMIAIGGTGMAPLACLLKEDGHQVRGSDLALYPPMSTLLEAAGIEPLEGFSAKHIDPSPDLIIVGNAVPRKNPEAKAIEGGEVERISMPEALSRFYLEDRLPLVVAGTHGKTTTTAMAAWVYTECGHKPGYLIGGVPHDLDTSFERGTGKRFVIEGDEYNAAYFDRGPKFLHYRPHAAVLTSVEYDHADLYPTPESLLDAYGKFVELLPADGLLVACGDAPGVTDVAARANCKTLFYGFGADNDIKPTGPVETSLNGSKFTLDDPEAGEIEITVPLGGEHNVLNAMAVWAVARHDGFAAPDVALALSRFQGVKRRMEEVGSRGGVLVIDDFAHHPTAIRATLEALKAKYQGRRLVVAFEPRSLTAGRSFLFDAYVHAFKPAARVFLAPIFHAKRLGDDALDLSTMVAELNAAGVRTSALPSIKAIEKGLLTEARTGDLVVTMSSGSFEGLPQRLIEKLG